MTTIAISTVFSKNKYNYPFLSSRLSQIRVRNMTHIVLEYSSMHRKLGKWIKRLQLDTSLALNEAFRIKTKALSTKYAGTN